MKSMQKKTIAGRNIALICGVSGQDGSLLARHLSRKGFQVYGASRDAETASFSNLDKLDIRQNVKLISIAANDFRGLLQALKVLDPDEIYNLAGQSSVGPSFDQPVETFESDTVGTVNYLEAAGKTHILGEFVATAFHSVGLDWRQYVIFFDAAFAWPTDIAVSRCNPTKAKAMLGWSAQMEMSETARRMVNQEYN